MHGTGNDFVVFDATQQAIALSPEVVRRIADRHFGVGCDQVLVIAPSETADFRMLIYNADGGEVEMCGNGIRCLFLYCRNHGLTTQNTLAVETAGGIVRPQMVEGGVCVDMGEPIFDGRRIPVAADGEVIEHTLKVDGRSIEISCVSMGNPHCVVVVEDVDVYPVERTGPVIERHAFFPERVNVEFVELVNESTLHQRTWERGAGETLA